MVQRCCSVARQVSRTSLKASLLKSKKPEKDAIEQVCDVQSDKAGWAGLSYPAAIDNAGRGMQDKGLLSLDQSVVHLTAELNCDENVTTSQISKKYPKMWRCLASSVTQPFCGCVIRLP